jgi:hypothetical protein
LSVRGGRQLRAAVSAAVDFGPVPGCGAPASASQGPRFW